MSEHKNTRVTAVSRTPFWVMAFVACTIIAQTMAGVMPVNASGGYYVGQGGETANYQAAYSRLGGAAKIGYPESLVHWWGKGCIQDLGGGSYGDAALMQPGCTGVVYVVLGNT